MGGDKKQQKLVADVCQAVEDLADHKYRKGAGKLDRRQALLLAEQIVINQHLIEGTRQACGNIPPVECLVKKSKEPAKRIVSVLLSDWHCGGDLKKDRTGSVYGKMEEARRLAAVCKQVIEYKTDHRRDSVLYVHLLGDLMDGMIHQPHVGRTLTEQVHEVVWLLVQALELFAEYYQEVRVFCTPGNHGRDISVHLKRATEDKTNGHEGTVYRNVRMALRNTKHIKFVIPRAPYYQVDYFGRHAIFTHGDTLLCPGKVGKAINVEKISTTVSKFNATRSQANKVSLVAVAHVHIGSCVHLPSGVTFFTNGALCPPNEFALSINEPSCNVGQWIFESTPEHIVGDMRLIKAGEQDDINEDLDQYIKPWVEPDVDY